MSEQTSNTVDLNRVFSILRANLLNIVLCAVVGTVIALIVSYFFVKTSNTVDLNRVFSILRANLLNIVLCAVVGTVIALIVSYFFVTPKYSSTIDLLVSQKDTNTQTQYTAQQADLQAINTYKDVLKKSIILTPVLKKIRENVNYQGDLSDLQSSVDISNQTNSQVISVTVTDKNAYIATDIANEIGTIFTEKIKRMMKIDNVTVVNKATVNLTPVSPNKKLNVLIGLLLGSLIGICISLIKELLDTTVKDSNFLREELGLINLGFIYHINNGNKDYRVVEVITDTSNEEDRRI
ncbi:YveK family protein [Ligilactobacillus murinus]|uniref:YveK family protein n=1 Tax=Ligilactobacillus murinus TaxID=1622 RepID=UPI00129852A7|nr:Wzz/FepE/Etk N-terminal domain-containing protein [Ligilactobacillus murinus]